MRALLLLLLAVTVAVSGLVWWRQQDDDNECVFSSTIYDGDVLPGGPQTAEEALDGFLASGAVRDHMPKDPDEYRRHDSGNGDAVTFVAGRVSIGASRRANGWFIGSAETTC